MIFSSSTSKQLYKRIKSRPPSAPRTPEQQLLHEKAQKYAMQSLNAAFMQYLSGTGHFANWENVPEIRETYVNLKVRFILYFFSQCLT